MEEIAKSSFCSGRFVLFRIRNPKTGEVIFVVRAHSAYSHKMIADAFQKEFKKSGWKYMELTVLGGAFMHVYEGRRTVVLNGASEGVGPVKVIDRPPLLHLIWENLLGFQVLYDGLEV